MNAGAAGHAVGGWRRHLVRGLVTVLAVKLVALILLKVVFFSEENRMHVTPDRVEQLMRMSAQGAVANGVEGVEP